MARNRFVVPNTVRVELSDGDWVELKDRLTYGEQQRLASSALTRMTNSGGADAGIELDFEKHSLMRMETWLVDWSFVGLNGKPVSITRAAIAALDPETAAEIDAAITKHVEEIEAAKNAVEKPGSAAAS